MLIPACPPLKRAVGDANVMRRPPRDPEEPILARQRWLLIAGYGAIIPMAVLSAFASTR